MHAYCAGLSPLKCIPWVAHIPHPRPGLSLLSPHGIHQPVTQSPPSHLQSIPCGGVHSKQEPCVCEFSPVVVAPSLPNHTFELISHVFYCRVGWDPAALFHPAVVPCSRWRTDLGLLCDSVPLLLLPLLHPCANILHRLAARTAIDPHLLAISDGVCIFPTIGSRYEGERKREREKESCAVPAMGYEHLE